MENQSIYNKICNIQITPHNIDPARLLTICLLHRLNRSMWMAIFPQKATTTACLGFFINPSSMLQHCCGCDPLAGTYVEEKPAPIPEV